MSKTRPSRRRTQQQQRFKTMRRWARFVLLALASSAVVAGGMAGLALWHAIASSDMFKISHIKVTTAGEQVPAALIARSVASYLAEQKGNFFSVDLSALQKQVQKNPWIASVSFRREWPGAVQVIVSEQKPLAQWGASALITEDGHIFSPSKASFPANLPKLAGPAKSAPEVLQEYRLLNEKLRPLGLQIDELVLSPQHVWRFVLHNGLKVSAGNENMARSMDRFINLYTTVIAESKQAAETVDLRYPNGATITWKQNK